MTPNALLISRLTVIAGRPGTKSGRRSCSVMLLREAIDALEASQARLNRIQELVE